MNSLTEYYLAEYSLPNLPDDAGEDYAEPRDIILYRFNDSNIILTTDYDNGVTLADAQEYCAREDTSGAGSEPRWFVGFDRR